MTQEEKTLLLKDLCARLLYKPRVRYYYRSMGSVAINGHYNEGYLTYQNLEDFSIYPKYGLEKTRICNILPYLRPMSSMTEEENKELLILWYEDFAGDSSLSPENLGIVAIYTCHPKQLIFTYHTISIIVVLLKKGLH